MAAEISVVPSYTVSQTIGDSVAVMIGIRTVIQCSDTGQANFIARKLNMARESKLHTAMNILTEQLGFSEDGAKYIYHLLLTDGHEGTLQ